MKEPLDIARSVLQIEIDALRRMSSALDDSFAKALEHLLDAARRDARIIVTGMGKSWHIGQKIAATLASTGVPASLLHPAEAMHGDIGFLRKGDLVIALSYSGESDELVTLLPLLRAYNVTIIAITGGLDSSLARAADVVLDASVEREACPFNLVPTASTTAALAMGDALAIALLEARGLTREDFARFHPGGAIGRSLLLKVDDIMRSGEKMARIAPDATLQEALLAMTGAQSGACVVVDGEGKLLGLFTDGDFRRALARDAAALSHRVESAMTRNPTSVKTGKLAAEALAVFREHRFDDLPVTDADNRVLGLIDLQDLPKFKIL